MSSSRFFVTRTVAQAIVIPPLLYVVLDNFRSAEVNRDNYCGSPQGEVAYARNFLRPFAHVIRSCIPSTVCGPDDMPFGRTAELEKYVLVYIERAALLYTISFEVSRRSGQPMTLDPSVYWCLSQAVTFDYFLGRPTYGYVPGAHDSFLSRISMAANLANKARGPSSTLDVPLTPDFASLPQVPSWSRSRIASLESLELINSWACENALLEDGIEQTQNVGRALEKSVTHADMGYAPNPSVLPASMGDALFTQLDSISGSAGDQRYPWASMLCPFMLSSSRPARLRSAKRLSRPELVILWIHRARHLAQGLHHTTNIATEEETPHETVGLIRDAVSVLLKNMVALGKASLKYGAIEGGDAPEYFVPSQGTTLFGMAEHFVDLYGYHGDGSPFDQALMFDNLNTLFRAMVLDEEYLQCGVDFPNFELAPVDLERYGIYEFIKPRQIARVHAEDPRIVRHQFGDRLLRYNPRLGEAARYTFPDPSQEYSRWNGGGWGRIGQGEREPVDHVENGMGASQKQVRQLLIRAPGAHVPSISRSLPLLNALSLEDHTLRLVCWRPSEGWAAFLEFRLRPMIYFVHAAVTHNFTLVGAKGVYSTGWDGFYSIASVVSHWYCCEVADPGHRDWCSRLGVPFVRCIWTIRYPPVIGMPGEATAMFEIMHRVCRSIGYPFDQESWVLNLNLLIPLAESARETRAVLQTELDYPTFDKHGQLLIPDFYSVEAWPQEGTFGIGKDGERVASDGYSVRVLGGKTAGVHAS
ncbi:hypothetical protein B0H14DRAFT_2587430 [Mycena olivaceomarginata]|nr:hypothetical protein B0H14DRAFT_2587430 [Mycena olivaceomarginata]